MDDSNDEMVGNAYRDAFNLQQFLQKKAYIGWGVEMLVAASSNKDGIDMRSIQMQAHIKSMGEGWTWKSWCTSAQVAAWSGLPW